MSEGIGERLKGLTPQEARAELQQLVDQRDLDILEATDYYAARMDVAYCETTAAEQLGLFDRSTDAVEVLEAEAELDELLDYIDLLLQWKMLARQNAKAEAKRVVETLEATTGVSFDKFSYADIAAMSAILGGRSYVVDRTAIWESCYSYVFPDGSALDGQLFEQSTTLKTWGTWQDFVESDNMFYKEERDGIANSIRAALAEAGCQDEEETRT